MENHNHVSDEYIYDSRHMFTLVSDKQMHL